MNHSINFGFSRRQRNDYITKELEKSNNALNQSVQEPKAQPKRSNSFIKTNPYADDSISNINSSYKEEEREVNKETQKRRTFSINASSLVPDRLK